MRSAHYENAPRIVLSLEGGAAEDVRALAIDFRSSQPNVEIREHHERLGLRQHILECGDYAMERGSVIVLEDDLLVDRYFYLYASRALDFYERHNAVAGVALYSPHYNEFSGLPFAPMRNGYDTYPIQTPCSSGQAWSASQWRAFRAWYGTASPESVNATLSLPPVLRRWPESSWKKYFAAYLVGTGRYFVYPYQSLTTNCSDAGGMHVHAKSDRFQVPLASQQRSATKPTFWSPDLAPAVSYDAFLEPDGEEVFRAIGLPRAELEVDILGTKPLELVKRKAYALTSRPVRAALRQFPLSFRPVELNLTYPEAVGEHSPPCLSLAESSAVLDGRQRLLEEYAYHANLDLTSLRFAAIVLRALPSAICRRIFPRSHSSIGHQG